jgi:Arc/MetJ-type ribon-helix-helix transcriptional regulator
MEKLIDRGVYGSRSEVVRDALRMLFEKYGEKIWER